MNVNLSAICRTCVNECMNMIPLSKCIITYEELDIPIVNLLNNLCDIKDNESRDYPQVICSACIQCVTQMYHFKMKCKRSTEFIESLLKSKTELSDRNNCNRKSIDFNDEISNCNDEDNDGICSYVLNTNDNQPVLKGNKKKYSSLVKKRRIKQGDNEKREEATYSCSQCNKTFTNKYILKAHEKRHVLKGQFLCNACGKRFNSQSCLTRHNRVHTGERNYECKICLKKFPSSTNLNLHSRTHSGLKPYLCTVCGKGFSHPTGLTYHMRTHTKEKPYICDVCGKKFAVQCHIIQHKKIHSGDRPFACAQCNKAFIKKNDLNRHEATHSGIKPFNCTICDRKFLRKIHLNYHMMVHTDDRPHVCDLCGRGFIRLHYLKDHKKKHHELENMQNEGNTE